MMLGRGPAAKDECRKANDKRRMMRTTSCFITRAGCSGSWNECAVVIWIRCSFFVTPSRWNNLSTPLDPPASAPSTSAWRWAFLWEWLLLDRFQLVEFRDCLGESLADAAEDFRRAGIVGTPRWKCLSPGPNRSRFVRPSARNFSSAAYSSAGFMLPSFASFFARCLISFSFACAAFSSRSQYCSVSTAALG